MDDFSMAVPSYIIYRDSEAQDGTSLAFFPPKDSDELFDALRAKFPHLRTHSERMRDAIIEFLMEERLTHAAEATASPMATPQQSASPWQQSFSVSSLSSTAGDSPEWTSLHTPSALNSAAPRPATIEGMTSVFSLSSAAEQPKQRLRRKMTEAEKVEYRRRRIMKACDKCAKRKRKCTHNQPSSNGTSVDKTQSEGRKSSNFNASHETIIEYDFDHNIVMPPSDIDFNDFTLLPSDPLLDYDNLYQPEDVNSFDMFSPSFVDHYIDPRQLSSQWTGSYASTNGTNSNTSPSSTGTSNLPSPITSAGVGELEAHLGLAKGIHLLQDSDEEGLTSSDHLRLPQSAMALRPHFRLPASLQRLHEVVDGQQSQAHGSVKSSVLYEPRSTRDEEAVLKQGEQQKKFAQHQRTRAELYLEEGFTLQHQGAAHLLSDMDGSSPYLLPQLPSLSTPAASPRSLRVGSYSQDALQGAENATSDKAATSSQSLGALVVLDGVLESQARAPLLNRAAPQGPALNRSTSTSMSTGESPGMASIVNNTDARSGLASRRIILKEASQSCTPRGVMPALDDPSLFEEQRTSAQGLATRGVSTSTDQSGMRSKRFPSPSGELFRLRRRISFGKDDDFMADRQCPRSMFANPKQPEIPSSASYTVANGSSETTNDPLAYRQQGALSSARPQLKAVHVTSSNLRCSSSSNEGYATADIADESYDEEAALQPRYKEYQRIDRFWVRDHHGRISSLPIAMVLLGLLLVSVVMPGLPWLRLATVYCLGLQGSLQDQRSAATRFVKVAAAGKCQILRHMASSGLGLMCASE